VNIWLTMIAAGLATFLIRLSFIWLLGRYKLPDWMLRALRFVPIAVFTAIIFPETLAPGGRLDLTGSNPRLLAGFLAVVVAWKTRNVIWVVVVGMGTLWALSLFH
jgi:branched-subunit amino acid transport protein